MAKSIKIDFSELTPDFIRKNTLVLPEEEGVGRMRWDNPTEPHPPISANGKVTITDGRNSVVLDFVYTYYQEIDKHYAHHCDLTKKGYLVPASDLFMAPGGKRMKALKQLRCEKMVRLTIKS